MTTHDTTYLILFAANLAFIVTHLYGWLLKWFYKPEAYREHFHELFPAQRSVGVIYLLQLFELPYLLQIGDRDALLYVNAFSLLFFSIQMLIMCEDYFFPGQRKRYRDLWLFLPAAVVLAPLFLQAVKHRNKHRLLSVVSKPRFPSGQPPSLCNYSWQPTAKPIPQSLPGPQEEWHTESVNI